MNTYDVMIPIAIIDAVVTFVLIAAACRTRQALVLKEFHLNEAEQDFLTVSGRSSGLFNWILSKYGIDPVTSLHCNKKAIRFEEAAVRHGKKTLNVPLVAVTGVSTGIHKPFGFLVAGMLFVWEGLMGAILLPMELKIAVFFIGVVLGGVFLLVYTLKKEMFFSIYSGGDKPIASICLKPSIIEGQAIDEHKTEAAAQALNNAVLKIHYLLAVAKNPSQGG